MPKYFKVTNISRTVGKDQVVDELNFKVVITDNPIGKVPVAQ
jgi:hypothetical protein